MTFPATGSVRLVFLGGLGEIGMNCLALEQEGGILVVDCGTTFPHNDLGIDVIHPSFEWLFDRADRVRGVFLTHGHEDHIGGLPYLLGELDVPIWGPPHALGLVRKRLVEHDFDLEEVGLHATLAGHTYEVGPFHVEPIRVSHSIVEATALRIATAAGTLVHSGDFRFDPTPPDGEPTDEARLAELGEAGVDLLLSDSTNIDVEDNTASERDVGEALETLVGRARHRVVIAMFASNIQRLMMLGPIAERFGRKICLLGRSLQTQVEIATEIGRLHWPSNLLVSPEQARTMPRDSLLVLAGGTQGERHSSMTRLSAGTHSNLTIEPGDTVLFSSRIIPGNEREVFAVMTDLLRQGAELHTRITDRAIHTSGHASRREQRHLIELLRPRAFMPIHGTLHHLRRHAELAREAGVKTTLVVENGSAVLFDGERLERDGRVPHGRVSVGYGAVLLGDDLLAARAELGRSGVVSISIGVDRKRRIALGPEIVSSGIAGLEEARARRSVVAEVVRRMEALENRRLGDEDLEDEIRRAVRRRVARLGGSRPEVLVHLLRTHG